jgi:hypothetical protein
LVFVVGSDAMLAVHGLLHKSIIRRFESAGPITADWKDVADASLAIPIKKLPRTLRKMPLPMGFV